VVPDFPTRASPPSPSVPASSGAPPRLPGLIDRGEGDLSVYTSGAVGPPDPLSLEGEGSEQPGEAAPPESTGIPGRDNTGGRGDQAGKDAGERFESSTLTAVIHSAHDCHREIDKAARGKRRELVVCPANRPLNFGFRALARSWGNLPHVLPIHSRVTHLPGLSLHSPLTDTDKRPTTVQTEALLPELQSPLPASGVHTPSSLGREPATAVIAPRMLGRRSASMRVLLPALSAPLHFLFTLSSRSRVDLLRSFVALTCSVRVLGTTQKYATSSPSISWRVPCLSFSPPRRTTLTHNLFDAHSPPSVQPLRWAAQSSLFRHVGFYPGDAACVITTSRDW